MSDTTDESLVISLGGVTNVAVSTLAKMSASEAGLLVAQAMLKSGTHEWSVPNFRAHAEASVRAQVPRVGGGRAMPREYEELDLPQVLADAFGWLISRGLLGPAAENSGATGEYRLTSAGRVAAESGDVGAAEAAYRLHADLHPALDEARLLFERGSYQTAVFAATHQVEVRVRELAEYGPDSYGVVMMRNAFHPETGPLASGDVQAERQAIQSLYAGTIGAFKNPASHRVVQFDNPTEAADIIHLADLLLRIAERSAPENPIGSV